MSISKRLSKLEHVSGFQRDWPLVVFICFVDPETEDCEADDTISSTAFVGRNWPWMNRRYGETSDSFCRRAYGSIVIREFADELSDAELDATIAARSSDAAREQMETGSISLETVQILAEAMDGGQV